MVCGVHKGGRGSGWVVITMPMPLGWRVGGPVIFAGKQLPSMVDCRDRAPIDDHHRGQLQGMALATVRALPPKP